MGHSVKSAVKRLMNRALAPLGIELQRVGFVPAHSNASLTADAVRKGGYFKRLLDKAAGVRGDIVECGVGWGESLIWLSFFASQEPSPRTIWAFDSFQGFPEPTGEDSSRRKPKKGEWPVNIETVQRMLERTGIDANFLCSRVKTVPGFFNETLDNYTGDSIALLHLDCDLYQSYKDCLEALFPKVAKGGIVAFDEYQQEKWPGATKAIDEYFGERTQRFHRDEAFDRYYFVND